jgi:transposase
MAIIRIGLDTSKHVFQVHGIDEHERPVLRRQLRRSEVEKFLPSCLRRRSAWKRAAPRTTGRGCCAVSGTRWC